MNGTVWSLEWRQAIRRRRLFAWNVVVPLLLLTPVALSGGAAAHRAAVYAVFFTFFGAFGAAIPQVRDAESGWTDKLLLTGYGARPWLLERWLAGTAQDLLQLLPVTLVLVAATGGWPSLVPVVVAITGALLVANGLGLLVAALVRSVAEAALVCAAAALALLHLAGVFRRPTPGSWGWDAARANPLRPLHEALRGLETPGPEMWPGWGWPAAAGLLFGLVILGLAPAVARRFSWPATAA